MSVPETLPYQDQLLEAALAEYEMALDEGGAPDRAAFLARYAAVAAELAPLLDAHDRIEALTRLLREALGGRPSVPFPRPDGYEILGVLGQGGMGVVYKARQRGTEQVVALKMLHPDWLGRLDDGRRDEAVSQFLLEVQAAARLRHPNRVRILHLGRHEGRPFYAMELIEGGSLAERAKRSGGLSKEAALKYLAGIAEAVHEAHQAGILHRDLKPHNILIDEGSDEALLTDFGLAKVARTAPPSACEESVRGEARLAGTLPYMSPEQTHDADRVTAASDVYSLGATLYELLTGSPPFEGRSRKELVEKIRTEEPVPPRRRRRDVNPRIEEICLKCLRKDPAQRYGTALDLAQALRRFLTEVRYARHFTSMGKLLLGLGPIVLLANLAVYFLIQFHAYEPLIWLVMFSMYPALFTVFLLAPGKDPGVDSHFPRVEMWSIWVGKMFAAISISIALRSAFAQEPEKALLLVYPVFAALSGMAWFIPAGRIPRKFAVLAVGAWLLAIAMVIQLKWAPIMYGAYGLIVDMVYGLYLRRVGRELS
jgi:predicted Ser/Thr protein kinase